MMKVRPCLVPPLRRNSRTSGLGAIHLAEDREANTLQRQTVVGHFFELDRLVVEGGISVCWAFPCGRLGGVQQTDLHVGQTKGKQGRHRATKRPRVC